MGKPTYQIKDWDKHFENHESRKLKRSYWVPLPNRHDGKSFRRIAAHPEGVAVFAAWTLILEVASKMPTRGILADEDGPLDSEDLAAMTGFPTAIFDSAFNLLTQQKFGWLTSSQSRVKPGKPPAISRNLPQSPGTSGETAAEWNGMEQKGMEENNTEGNGTEDQPRASRAEKRGTRLPDDFCLNSEKREWAAENTPHVDLNLALAEFVDYWRGVPGQRGRKLDWDATWRNRLRELEGRKNGARRGVSKAEGSMDAVRSVLAECEK